MYRLIWLSVCFACACGLSLFLPQQVPLLLGAVAALLCLVVRLRCPQRRRVLWLCFGLTLGFLWFFAYSSMFYLPAQQLAGRTVRLDEAVVTQWPSQTQYGLSVPVRGGEAGQEAFALQLQLSGFDYDLRPGDRISTIAHCHSIDDQVDRFSLNRRAKGYYLTAKAYGTVQISRPERPPLRYAPALLSQWLRDQIQSLYPADCAPLFTALLTGWQTDLRPETRSDLSRSGLAHVVSVSGMHISFLAGAFAVLIRSRNKKSILLQLGLIFFFAAMTGSSAGALRAAILCASTLLAPLFGRRSHNLTALFGALFFLLLQNPFAIASISLQLSFAATLGIYLIGQALNAAMQARLPHRFSRIVKPPCSLLSISLGASVFTLPLSALYFSQTSLIAPLANLLCEPLICLTFLGGILSVCFVALVPPVAALIAFLSALPAKLFLSAAHGFATIPFAAMAVEVVYFKLFFVFLYAVLLLSIYFWWRGQRRLLLPLCSCVCAFCTAALLHAQSLNSSPLTLTALDVGQGQSLLLSSGSYRALIDCGGTRQAGAVAANTLAAQGRNTLDLLILTHEHADHSNGLAELLSRVRVARIALPELAETSEEYKAIETLAAQYGIDLWYIGAQTEIPFGKAKLQLYPPLSRTGQNEMGLSILCSFRDQHALITGDMDAETEQRLVARYPLPPLSLLVVGHHGSRFSTSAALLDATEPARAFLSVGKNTYGHPAPDTLSRLEDNDTALYRTDMQGNLTFFAAETEDSYHATQSQTE